MTPENRQIEALQHRITLLEKTIGRLQSHKVKHPQLRMLTGNRSFSTARSKHTHFPKSLVDFKLRHRSAGPDILKSFHYPRHPMLPSYPYYSSNTFPEEEYWE